MLPTTFKNYSCSIYIMRIFTDLKTDINSMTAITIANSSVIMTKNRRLTIIPHFRSHTFSFQNNSGQFTGKTFWTMTELENSAKLSTFYQKESNLLGIYNMLITYFSPSNIKFGQTTTTSGKISTLKERIHVCIRFVLD